VERYLQCELLTENVKLVECDVQAKSGQSVICGGLTESGLECTVWDTDREW